MKTMFLVAIETGDVDNLSEIVVAAFGSLSGAQHYTDKINTTLEEDGLDGPYYQEEFDDEARDKWLSNAAYWYRKRDIQIDKSTGAHALILDRAVLVDPKEI